MNLLFNQHHLLSTCPNHLQNFQRDLFLPFLLHFHLFLSATSPRTPTPFLSPRGHTWGLPPPFQPAWTRLLCSRASLLLRLRPSTCLTRRKFSLVSELILPFLADQVSIIQPNSFFLKYNIHILYINWWCLTYDYAPKSPGYSWLFLCLVTLKAVYFVLFCVIFVFAQPYASSHTGPKLT